MSDLAESIKKFCVPRVMRWRNGLGEPGVSTLECPAGPCRVEAIFLTAKTKYKHAERCPLSLLRRLGDGKELQEQISRWISDLDYDGGGYCSCTVCGGRTQWKEGTPRHLKGCPVKITLKTEKGMLKS